MLHMGLTKIIIIVNSMLLSDSFYIILTALDSNEEDNMLDVGLSAVCDCGIS